jgi:hypothetical protein
VTGENKDMIDDKVLELLGREAFTEAHAPDAWFSHDRRKWFSRKVLRDHSLDWVRLKLKGEPPKGEYWFYFSNRPQLVDFERLLSQYDLDGLKAVIRQ